MKQLDDLMEKITIDDLENGTLEYKEELNYEDLKEELNKKKIGVNYWLWKYYCGSISKEEYVQCKENPNLSQELDDLITIYDYIFNEKEVDEQFVKNAGSLELLQQLWIMRPRNHFQYEDAFNKLIYQVYIKTKDESMREIRESFREIALKYYNENKEKRNDQTNDEMFLICNDKSEMYNKKYGIYKP